MDHRQETLKKIKSLLRSHRNGLTITDIAQKLQLNRNSTAKYLEILSISGDVNLSTYGPAKVYTISHRMPVSAMLKFSADLIMMIDNELRIMDANENAVSFLGIARDQIGGSRITDVNSPFLARLAIPEVYDEIQKDGEVLRDLIIPLRGEDRHFRVRLIPTVFDNMEDGLTLIAEDVTKQVRFEESLMISEARYRATVEDQNEFICRFRPDGTITFANDAYCRYFGLDKESSLGVPHWVTLPDEDARMMNSHLAALTREKPVRSIEHRIIMPGGHVVWHYWSDRAFFNPRGDVVEYLSVGRDITIRKLAEEAVQKSEKMYRSILDNIRDVFFRCDMDGTFQMVSPSGPRLLGYASPEELCGKHIGELAYSREKDAKDFLALLQKEREVNDYEMILKKRDGSPVIVSINCSIIPETAGIAMGIEGIFRDITYRTKVESAIKQSEERFHKITDLSPSPISITDREGNFLYLNRGFSDIFGYRLEELKTEQNWFLYAFPDDAEREKFIRTWQEGGQDSRSGGLPCIFPVTCRDGSIRPISFFWATLDNGERFIVYEDLSVKKESEQLHAILASIVNSSDDVIALYRGLSGGKDSKKE